MNFLIFILKMLQPFFKQDRYILFDDFAGKNTECIDSYSLFIYMRDKGMNAYYCIWHENKFYEELKTNNDLKNVIVLNKKNAHGDFLYGSFWHLVRAKYVITSFGWLPAYLTHFLYHNKRLVYFRIGHGKTFLKSSHLLRSHMKFNKFLVSCKAEQDILIHLGWSPQNLPILGIPRWDMLVRAQSRQKSIFVMFTWRKTFLQRWRKAYPADEESSEYFKKIYAFMNNPQLQKLLVENNVKMKFAMHHALVDLAALEFPNFANIETVMPTNVSKHIGTADLLITDYSSIAFDFLFLNTPVIFYRPDFNDMKLCEDDLIDFNNAKNQDEKLFNICYDQDSTIALLQHYIRNGFLLEDENKDKAAKMFAVRENIRAAIVEYTESSFAVSPSRKSGKAASPLFRRAASR